MNKRVSEQIAGRGLQLGILLIGLMLVLPVHAKVDVKASIKAPGQGAIFDVKAKKNGKMQVATKAGRVGDRWRVTIVQANGDGAVSAVGSGSATDFSGWVASKRSQISKRPISISSKRRHCTTSIRTTASPPSAGWNNC